MSNATTAINKVLLTEGGYVNHPADRGGPTNWGITQKTYESWIGRSSSLQEIINMPKETAIAIYKANYWDRVGGDFIKSYAVAYAIFDQAVNRGIDASLRQAQKVLGISQTGNLSNEFISAINLINPQTFIDSYLVLSEQAYKTIVANNPSQAIFLTGWLNRVEDLKSYTQMKLTSIFTTVSENPIYFALPAIAIFGVIGYYYLTTNENQGRKYASA